MSRNKRRKSNRFATALMMLMAAAAGTVALALYVKLTPADRVIPASPESSVKGMPAQPNASQVRVLIPTIRYETDKLGFEQRDFIVPAGGDPRVEAVSEFLKSTKILDGRSRLMEIDVEDGVAGLHFTEGFDSGDGSMDEAALIYGLRAVLGQFEDIRQFRIFVDGRQIEGLGHFEFGDLIDTIPVSRWNDPVETMDEGPPPSMPR